MSGPNIEFVLNEKGETKGVIIPIRLWRELMSERETAYLLKSARMKQRLMQAKRRREGIPLEKALAQLGI
jgi:PHD/YefM family antitoxin component YafN of YafNO toxin-antitoxin module